MTIIDVYCIEKTGRPNQAQGAPGHGIPGCLRGWSEPYTEGIKTSIGLDPFWCQLGGQARPVSHYRLKKVFI